MGRTPVENEELKQTLVALKERAREYRELGQEIKRLTELQAQRRADCLATLERFGRDAIGFAQDDGTTLKPRRYEIVKIVWNMKRVIPLLRKRGLQRVVRLAVDEPALNEAVREGAVALEELHTAADRIVRSWGFRVDCVKSSGSDGE